MTSHKVQGLVDDGLGAIVLDGKKLDARIDQAVTAASLERSIGQASQLILTTSDPERLLLRGGYFERRADLLLDDLWFRMVQIQKQNDTVTLTFEDREVALLRRHTKPHRASRAHRTRAEFLQMLVRQEPHIEFVSPELHKREPIARRPRQVERQLRESQRAPGIAADAALTVKGKSATHGQIDLMNRVLNVAESLGAGKRATLGMIVANIGEASYDKRARNPNSGAFGLFQLLPSTARSTGLDPLDIEACANYFLTTGFYKYGGAMKVARDSPHDTPGTIASKVEGSDQGGTFYDAFIDEAKAILAAYGGVGSEAPPQSPQYVQQYAFMQGPPDGPKGESAWDCGLRLADQVHWRFFIAAGVVYYIDDWDLIRSRPRMTLSETTPGIDTIDFDLDTSRKKPDQITITCRAARWAAPPGTVVALTQDLGPAAGAWIVSDIVRQDITDQATEITLTRPRVPLPEPAAQVATRAGDSAARTLDGGVNAGDLVGSPAIKAAVAKAFAKAGAIDAQHLPYIWGGGHGRSGVPSGSSFPGPQGFGNGYDCSGAVSAVIHTAGWLGDTPLTTDGLLNWGTPGKGRYVTVWVNAEHTFMEFNLPGRTVFFEFHHTGTIGGFEQSRDTTDFHPRHYPGS